MEQLGSYGPKGRDPRGEVLTVAHLLLAPDFPVLSAGSDAGHAAWYPVGQVLNGGLRLAFGHERILGDALERAKSKLEYSPLGAAFCGDEFTMAQLRAVYEAVWGTRLDPPLMRPRDRRRREMEQPLTRMRAGAARCECKFA